MGGCSILFLRLARYLTLKGLAECVLVDFVDGYMALNAFGIPTREYGAENIYIEEGAIFVTQSSPPWTRFERITFAPKARLFYWNVHPFNLVPVLPFTGGSSIAFRKSRLIKSTLLRSHYSCVSNFVLFLSKSGGLAFMDRENLISTEEHLEVLIEDPKFLPIPVDSKPNIWIDRKHFSTQINLLWVGRVVDFKYHILRFAITQIGAEKTSDISLTIVGDGDYLARLQRFCLSQRYTNIYFRAPVPHESLQNLMLQFDLILAMGTTAIEAGMLGIPVVIMDPSYGVVKESYSFRWLHDVDSFDLGSFSYHRDCERIENSQPRLLMDLVSQYRINREDLSERVHTYTYTRHSLDNVVPKFMEALMQNMASVAEAEEVGFGKRSISYRLYLALRDTFGKRRSRANSGGEQR